MNTINLHTESLCRREQRSRFYPVCVNVCKPGVAVSETTPKEKHTVVSEDKSPHSSCDTNALMSEYIRLLFWTAVKPQTVTCPISYFPLKPSRCLFSIKWLIEEGALFANETSNGSAGGAFRSRSRNGISPRPPRPIWVQLALQEGGSLSQHQGSGSANLFSMRGFRRCCATVTHLQIKTNTETSQMLLTVFKPTL